MPVMSEINRTIYQIPKRAEQRHADSLRETFVDSGIGDALETVDHQVLYGRRGTGKTHALRYLEAVRHSQGDMAIYVDLMHMGSPDSLFMGRPVPPVERASRLFVDLMGHIHEHLYTAAINGDGLQDDWEAMDRLDHLAEAITRMQVVGGIQSERTDGSHNEVTAGFHADIAADSFGPRARLGAHVDDKSATSAESRTTRNGEERFSLNISEISRLIRDITRAISPRRIWLLLDEWISIPPEVQPYVGELLLRTLGHTTGLTIKIASIEQQSRFSARTASGKIFGLTLGADAMANLDLDEFMVFDHDEDLARDFLKNLILKHLSESLRDSGVEPPSSSTFVQTCFADARAFEELVRAGEGVPRDALNVLGTAARHAGQGKISIPHLRQSAHGWFQRDKADSLHASDEAADLLHWIIDEVIKGKRAKGFLVNQRDSDAPLLMALFDSRVLHLLRRGYSAQDKPGERYNVYAIDYGAYVDLMQTKYAPQGVLPIFEDDDYDPVKYVSVPTNDFRSLRRAIVDLNEFRNRKNR